MVLDKDQRLRKARDWFAARGREPFEFQEALWQAYWAGESGLLNAGTGTGKTFAAWLGPVIESLSEADQSGVRVVWVTPLRALARDLERALQEPLEFFGSQWRVEQRTGDTSGARRAKQKTRPPQALITTPESLSLLLTHADMLQALSNLNVLIVDEWHEFLGTKRGVQMELVAARLRALNPSLRVWGLSATLPDLPGAMRALLGNTLIGQVIRAPPQKRYVIDSLLPESIQRFPWGGHLGLKMLPQVLERLEQGRTSLIFTNTRSQAELWYQAIITARLDWLTSTAIHHGSIDAKIRRRVEEGLKSGSLRCVVCTSSLDLGVDFPPVDQVLQIGSPKGIARLLQRAGRSGHKPGEASRATIVPTLALELLEAVAARRAVARMELEPRPSMTLALDVLAQHLVTLAIGGGFDAANLLSEVRTTHAFEGLSDEQWAWVLDFITRGGTALQGYPQFRRVEILEERYVVQAADLVRRHRQNVGTISSDAAVTISWMKGGVLGSVEESFVGRLRPGAVFIFAGRTLQLVSFRDSVAYVRLASGSSRFVPRWQGARLPLSVSLGLELLDVLGAYTHEPDSVPDPELVVLRPLLELQERWSAMPAPGQLLIEALENREGFHLFVFPFLGRLLNEGIASLVAMRAAREVPRTFSITTNEYGFELLCAQPLDVDQTALRRWFSEDDLIADMLASVNVSDLARRQFRDIARIAGLVDGGRPRRGKTARQLQVSSGLMFDVLERYDASNLLLQQARREVLEGQLDHAQLLESLQRIGAQTLRVTTPDRYTPLSFPLWADRLQTQTLSTESWQRRVEREARKLDRMAR
jgi:ATP-dependent Lhr-like helicase